MAAQGVITLNTVPYNPRGKQGDVALWYAKDATKFGGGPSTITESIRGPNSKTGVTRIEFKLDQKLLATDSSVCACVGSELGYALARIEVLIPSGFTDAQRSDFTNRLQGLIGNAIVSSAINFFEPAW